MENQASPPLTNRGGSEARKMWLGGSCRLGSGDFSGTLYFHHYGRCFETASGSV